MKIILNLVKVFGWVIIAIGTIGLIVELTSGEINWFALSFIALLFVAGGAIVSWSRKRLNLTLSNIATPEIKPKNSLLSANNWLTENTWFGPTFLIVILGVFVFVFVDRYQESDFSILRMDSSTKDSSTQVSQAVKESVWMEKGKEAVRKKLKDANSATFRKVYFHSGADNIPMTCGEVNSKNSFGGFTGYQRFVSAGKDNLTFLQEQVADFNTIWNKFCQ